MLKTTDIKENKMK